MAEQVQVECKIKRSGQVRWRAAGELGGVKGDEKLTACFGVFLLSLCHVRRSQKTGFRYQNGCKLELNIFLLSQKKEAFRTITSFSFSSHFDVFHLTFCL